MFGIFLQLEESDYLYDSFQGDQKHSCLKGQIMDVFQNHLVSKDV